MSPKRNFRDPGDLKKIIVLTKRKFNLDKDFPKLMRRYKRDWLEGRITPSVTPVK